MLTFGPKHGKRLWVVERMPSGFRDWLRQKPDMGEAEGPLKDLWVLKAPNYA